MNIYILANIKPIQNIFVAQKNNTQKQKKKCKYCPKRFAAKCNCIVHIRTHS